MTRTGFWVAVIVAVTLGWQTAAHAEDPVPTKKRIVLHGVGCGPNDSEICAPTLPVLDEAVEMLKQAQDGRVVVSAASPDVMGTNQDPDAADPSAAAVMDYLAVSGISPGLCELQGFTQ